MPLVLPACNQNPPVYEQTGDTIFLGSVYYDEAGCVSCHATDFKGGGPDASALSVAVPDLTGELAVDTTPVDYFKVITRGTDALPSHSYQSYTDRGRWAMAYFLYSMGQKPTDEADMQKRREALARDFAEAEEGYKQNPRRWILGFQPPGQRTPSPALSTLVSGVNLAEAPAAAQVDENRRARFDANRSHPSASYYANNCAGCHGKYAEGKPTGERFGLVPQCEGRNRQCGVYLSTEDMARTDVSAATFERAHAAGSMILPGFSALTDDGVQSLMEYIRVLSGK
ncbi:MAG: c-type cytochrome [Leptospiraceae bacterium]|nr:c-type cytochrome [Leptospiraceae bacterium]